MLNINIAECVNLLIHFDIYSDTKKTVHGQHI